MSEPTTEKILLNFITPDKSIFMGEVSMVVIPGIEGDFGVLPRHSLFVSTLRPGDVKIYQGKEVAQVIGITGGIAEVSKYGCQILAEGLLEDQNNKTE